MKQLITDFKKARKEFIIELGRVPQEKREVVVVGDWILQDVLSHFIGWADFQIKVIKSLIKGKEPFNFSRIDEFNKESTNLRKKLHWDKIYDEFLRAGERLISAYISLPENLWTKPIWKNKKTTLEKLIKIETRHYQGKHLEQIKKITN